MGSHPLNLIIRFLLELAALVALGAWGWQQGSDANTWLGYVLALGLPIISATVWGVFNVPNDPSRSGNAPVVIPGLIRLALELAFFALATWALYDLDYTRLTWLLGVVVTFHYLISYDRICWLIKQ